MFKFFLFLFFFLCYFLTEIEANYKMENFTTIEMTFLREKFFGLTKSFRDNFIIIIFFLNKFSRQLNKHYP